MKIKLLIAALAVIVCTKVKADEGMWIPSLIGKNYNAMKRAGLKLTAADIYDINHASLKDAIVSLMDENNRQFCTAEIVSNEGLLFTNHHCAFNAIADQSSAENNYLANGFWATEKSKELPTKAQAAILKEIIDVTPTVLKGINGLAEDKRRAALKAIGDSLSKAYKKEKFNFITFAEFFSGNQYFIFVYEKYSDVRLVGAPQESIGKFGGDTDNWMWPRHTGDFSVMRIYADKNNKPSDYSKDNKAFTPKRNLKISMKGVQNGDYAMIMGFPGRTKRYEFSKAIERLQATDNPIHIKYWKFITENMKADMDKDINVDLKLAGKYAQLMNYYKYSIGQSTQLKRLHTIEKLKANEDKLAAWINADENRKKEFGNLLSDAEKIYSDFIPYENYRHIIRYGVSSIPTTTVGMAFYNTVYTAATAKDAKLEDIKKAITPQIEEAMTSYFKTTNIATDRKNMRYLLAAAYDDIPANQRSEGLNLLAGNKMKIADFVDDIFNNSLFTNENKEKEFLKNPTSEAIMNDPLMKFMDDFFGHYKATILAKSTKQQNDEVLMKRAYAKALLQMNEGKLFYPDANSTERVTYGNVKDYYGMDAVHYKHYTTANGILEKEDSTNEEFHIASKQHNMLMKKDYGRYADKKDGDLHVAFLTTNDITGGNSGSPVIDASGNQIGIAFDGNWEAMSGDVDFSGDQKRTICVDIRYVLWCIDKYAGASNLINELNIVE
ncbi:MAG: hypothetical protein RIQ33_2399 [Bacteroidota bacterium]|jgi:hypothetical protein